MNPLLAMTLNIIIIIRIPPTHRSKTIIFAYIEEEAMRIALRGLVGNFNQILRKLMKKIIEQLSAFIAIKMICLRHF